jgi:hypothetical protein
MRPEITKALREVGLVAKPEDSSLGEKLEAAGLGLDSVLENLASLAHGSESDHLRLRANETILRMHGVLNPDSTGNTAAPTVQIVIQSEEPVNLDFLKPPSINLNAKTGVN